MSSSPPQKPIHNDPADDENIKTVKLSTDELRQQLQALGVDLEDNHDDGDDPTGDDPAADDEAKD